MAPFTKSELLNHDKVSSPGLGLPKLDGKRSGRLIFWTIKSQCSFVIIHRNCIARILLKLKVVTSKHIKSPFSAVASSISRVKSVGVPPPEPPSTVTVPELVVTGTLKMLYQQIRSKQVDP